MTCRRVVTILTLIWVVSALPAQAQVGIDIAGLSWHTSSNELEGFNPGLGARYLFLRRANWRADVFGGGFRNSERYLALTAAVGAQRRVFGPVHAGFHLFAFARGQELERIYTAPLPMVTAEVGPLDLNLLYLPRLRGFTGESAVVGFNVTVWPFGGRGPVTAGAAAGGRVALEFGVASGPGLTDFTGQTLSARWLVNERQGWRVGLDLAAWYRKGTERLEYRETGESADFDSSSGHGYIALQIQHVRVLSGAGASRLLGSVGPRLIHQYEGQTNDWYPGFVLGLGAEVDVISGLALLGEYTTSMLWRFLAPYGGGYTYELQAGARLGVVLWW